MQPNVNPDTGIRYGIIKANSLKPWVLDEIQTHGRDVRWEAYCEEVKDKVNADEEIADDDKEAEIERILESDDYYCDESIHEHTMDGVNCRTTWMGGGLLVWIFKSEVTGTFRLCSPCVPNCADLDNPDPDGYEGYTVPADWLWSESSPE